jgi:hypothetical protein
METKVTAREGVTVEKITITYNYTQIYKNEKSIENESNDSLYGSLLGSNRDGWLQCSR